MPAFEWKSEKFELFEDLFQISLKIHNQIMEENKINYFHSIMRVDALQTLKNITSLNRENLGEIRTVFHRKKNVKTLSMATTNISFNDWSSTRSTGLQPGRLVFNPVNQKLIVFLDELQKQAEDAFRVAIQVIIEQFEHAKMPLHPKKLINRAHLENSTYKSHILKEVGTERFGNSRWAKDKNCDATNHTNSKKPNQQADTAKKPGSCGEPMPSTQTRDRPGPKQHKECRHEQQQKRWPNKLTLTLRFPTTPTQSIQTVKNT